MNDLVQYDLPDGEKVYVEVDPKHPQATRRGDVSRGDGTISEKAALAFKDAVGFLSPLIKTCVDALRAAGPDEVEMSFSFSLTGEANAWIAASKTEGAFEITVRYKKDQQPVAKQ